MHHTRALGELMYSVALFLMKHRGWCVGLRSEESWSWSRFAGRVHDSTHTPPDAESQIEIEGYRM
jgi:hypothetical protein